MELESYKFNCFCDCISEYNISFNEQVGIVNIQLYEENLMKVTRQVVGTVLYVILATTGVGTDVRMRGPGHAGGSGGRAGTRYSRAQLQTLARLQRRYE